MVPGACFRKGANWRGLCSLLVAGGMSPAGDTVAEMRAEARRMRTETLTKLYRIHPGPSGRSPRPRAMACSAISVKPGFRRQRLFASCGVSAGLACSGSSFSIRRLCGAPARARRRRLGSRPRRDAAKSKIDAAEPGAIVDIARWRSARHGARSTSTPGRCRNLAGLPRWVRKSTDRGRFVATMCAKLRPASLHRDAARDRSPPDRRPHHRPTPPFRTCPRSDRPLLPAFELRAWMQPSVLTCVMPAPNAAEGRRQAWQAAQAIPCQGKALAESRRFRLRQTSLEPAQRRAKWAAGTCATPIGTVFVDEAGPVAHRSTHGGLARRSSFGPGSREWPAATCSAGRIVRGDQASRLSSGDRFRFHRRSALRPDRASRRHTR